MFRIAYLAAAFAVFPPVALPARADEAPKSIVFVVDRSGSLDGAADLVKSGLAKAIGRLTSEQRFNIIWFSEGDTFKMAGSLVQATDDNKKRCVRHLADVTFKGGSDPRSAVFEAISFKPAAVFIVTDGEFDAEFAGAITKKNGGRVALHCVGIRVPGGEGHKSLARLAEKNGGKYTAVDGTKPAEADKLADALSIKLPPPKPEFSLTAKDFAAEFKKGEKAAAAKYKGRLIELTGTITELNRNASGDPLIFLDGNVFTGVTCVPVDRKPWLKMSPGQKVRLTGTPPDFSIGTTLDQCVVLEVTGDPCPSMTADELAKEYGAGHEAAGKKYKDKWIVIEGEVASKEANDAGAVSLTLKTAGKTAVRCNFTAFDKDWTNAFKPGDKLKLMGQYWSNDDPKRVTLYFCLSMK